MSKPLIQWDVYEVSSKTSSLNGVMLRGRIRKLGLEKNFNVLTENTEDTENGVRFAVMNTEDAEIVSSYIKSIISDALIELKLRNTPNPVLSKLKVNTEARYEL